MSLFGVTKEQTPLDWDAILPKELGLVFRSRWTELSLRYGLPFSRKTMQNLDSEGRGPAAVMVAGKVAFCQKHRLSMVADALLVLRHYLARPSVLADRTASFEIWSDSVRRTVAGIAADGLMNVTDPVAAIESSYAEDPDTLKIMAMLNAWEAVFGAREITTKELLQTVEKGVIAARKEDPDIVPESAMDALKAVVTEVAGEGRSINTTRYKNKRSQCDEWLCSIESSNQRHGISLSFID